MKERELCLIYSYILNHQTSLEQELAQLQTNIRYRRIDHVDCLELICAVERLNTFKETTKDILTLIKYDKDAKKKLEKLESETET